LLLLGTWEDAQWELKLEERFCEIAARRLSQDVFYYREACGLPEQLLLSL